MQYAFALTLTCFLVVAVGFLIWLNTKSGKNWLATL